MAFDLRKWILDIEQSLRGPLQAWGWIIATCVIVFCLIIVLGESYFPLWSFRIAQVILFGASTAIFTRFLGGMGMFRDAIADVLGDDRWLDRRNDLEDLWRRITRRIFLPGFREDARDAAQLLSALNRTMTGVIHKPEQRLNYYARNMVRRMSISWADERRRIVVVDDYMETSIIPFNEDECKYEMILVPTTGEKIDAYTISLK